MPYKNYIPLDLYFNTPDGFVPLGDVQEVMQTPDTDLNDIKEPGAYSIVGVDLAKEASFTAPITITGEAAKILNELTQAWANIHDLLSLKLAAIKTAIDSGQHRRVVHLALYHRDTLVRKKNMKRLIRYYKRR